MPGYLKVELCGHLGRDPEIRYSRAGDPIANLSVGCSYRVKKGGDWQEETEWVKVVAFNKMAEQAQEMRKGDLVVVLNGRLKTNKWEKDGVPRYTTEVIANVMFKGVWAHTQGGGEQNTHSRDESDTRGNVAPKQEQKQGQGGAAFDDDLPFAQYGRGSDSYVM